MTEVIKYDDEIELIDILRVLWKWKWFILGLAFISVVMVSFFVIQKNPVNKIAKCTITLNFPGIEKHKNPDGSLFEKGDIIRPEIIAIAYKAFSEKQGKSVQDLFSNGFGNIDIVDVIPADIQKKIAGAEKKGAVYLYYPNIFALKISTHQGDLISNDEVSDLLLEIVNAYKSDFQKSYGIDQLVTIDFPDGFIETYEYRDIMVVLEKEASQLVSFLTSKIKETGSFKSKKTGFSFVDIKNKVEIMDEIYLNRMSAIIQNMKLSRDRGSQINILETKIKKLEVQKQKKEKEAAVSYKLLAYMGASSGNNSQVLTSSNNNNGSGVFFDSSFLDNIKKGEYISYLLKLIIEAETHAINNTVEIEFLKKDIKSIKQQKNENSQVDFIIKNVTIIKDKLVEYSALADELNSEYLQAKIENSVTLIRSPQISVSRGKNLRMIVLLTFIASLFIAVFTAFFIEYLKNKSIGEPASVSFNRDVEHEVKIKSV